MFKIGALALALSIQGASGSATARALANGSNDAHPSLALSDLERALTINNRYRGLP